MKIALLTDLFQNQPVERALEQTAQAGFDAIELNGIPYWEPHITFYEDQTREVERYRGLLKSFGLTLYALCVQPDICVLDEEESRVWLDYCQNAISFGQALGARVLFLIFSGNPFFEFRQQADRLFESLNRMNEQARQTDMQLAVEIHPGSFVKTTKDACALLREYGLSNVGYLFCTPHVATYCAEDVLTSFCEAKDIVRHVHFADTPLSLHNHKHLAPGHGELNLAGLRDAITQSGYDRGLTLQIYSEATDKVAVAARARQFLLSGNS